MATLEEQLRGKEPGGTWKKIPWWLLIILAFLTFIGVLIIVNPEYRAAFNFIVGNLGSIDDLLDGEFLAFIGKGISVTLYVTVVSFVISIFLGLLAGLGRVSHNTAIRNVATTYVEFVRGLPVLVLIFTFAFVVVPEVSDLIGFDNRSIPGTTRGIIALSFFYGAFIGEIFRAGIESIPHGQTEAARSLGLTGRQSMRYIILPQAVRNILPALGNDFIAILKDSSLLSVLAVREITQQSRLYSGSTFRFREAFLVLTFLYLSLTIVLSLILQWYGRRIKRNE
ncbi:MAG: amino acid ABC transporter permease [Anaerolineae bacterium]|nr:MAG: amino acid ABC transporter permease [Anaerolineae bacterium]